jgi:FkbM family methyltransferase
MGFKLAGNQSMQQGSFEIEETEVTRKILKKVDTLINVGANIGYYCCIALSLGKHVVAFEPIPSNLNYLLRNIKANNWEDEIEVFPLALSNKVGIIKMYGGGTGASLVKGWAGSSEKYVTLVPNSTMDIVLGSRFQGDKLFIIVDIEGAEKLMLEGASSFLFMKPKPIWLMEISVSEHQPKGNNINPNLFATFEMFWDMDYEAWTADKQCRRIHPDEVKSIVKSNRDTLLTHNFLFIERGCKTEILDT